MNLSYIIGEDYIKCAINTFYNLIADKEEGAPDTRYRSWEWCHKVFIEEREKYRVANEEDQAKIVDYLSLHLAFYLASWGMYRGSSYLLQRDYKTHKNTVRILLDERYDSLWEYCPQEVLLPAQSAQSKLILDDNGLYNRIKKAYRGYYEDNEDEASDTLVTKILMGTMSCIPAFDRFLKRGIKWLSQNYSAYNAMHANIESKKYKHKTFAFLEIFAYANKDVLIVENSAIDYPVMKCVDMFLWQVGFELDIYDGLNDARSSDAKKKKLIESAKKLGICNNDDDIEAVKECIIARWKVADTPSN